jgi:predicted RNase H-like HicB family nuclease
MKIRVELEYDAESKGWSAVCPELPGCASGGNTEQEALENIKEAIELYLQPVPEKSTPGAKSVIIEV